MGHNRLYHIGDPVDHFMHFRRLVLGQCCSRGRVEQASRLGGRFGSRRWLGVRSCTIHEGSHGNAAHPVQSLNIFHMSKDPTDLLGKETETVGAISGSGLALTHLSYSQIYS